MTLDAKDHLIIALIHELHDCGMEETAEEFRRRAVRVGIKRGDLE